MKKAEKETDEAPRPEYERSDFGELVRGKYASRIAEETNVVVLDPEVAAAFPNDAAVNEALHGLLDLARATVRRGSRRPRARG
jgi:hypothetical protein